MVRSRLLWALPRDQFVARRQTRVASWSIQYMSEPRRQRYVCDEPDDSVRWIESSSIATHSGRTALRRSLGETMFLPTLIILIVLAPVLLPAIIPVVHLLTG